jgi:hypothetical protein
VHLLLQTRVKTLNCELGSVLKRWYPDMEVIAMLSTSPWGLSFLRRMEYHGSCKGPLCARRHRQARVQPEGDTQGAFCHAPED